MIGVALLYSVTSTLGKEAVAASSPVFFAALYFPALALVLTPVAFRRGGREVRGMLRSGVLKAALWPAVFYAVMVIAHMTAIGMTQVAYMISVKRLSLLMGVLYGYFLFGEAGNGKTSIAAKDLMFPNGSVITPDGSTLIVDETFVKNFKLGTNVLGRHILIGDGTDDAPAYFNTFQRGSNESVWETVPHPSCETFAHGGDYGYLDLFTDDEAYSEQWRYTNAPDADARAVQVAYLAHEWASEQGNGSDVADSVAKASMMGDYLRYAMFDKYFKEIGDCVGAESCPPGTGRDSAHYLLSWYYSWGGAMESAEYPWAWRIGGSSAHQGYQNVMAAYALSEVEALRPRSATGADDWGVSLDRQLEFIQWLQSSDGGIAGGATNSWEGVYGEPPAGTPTFYGMYYDEKPVWHDPPSNQWFGFQIWDIERVAEYHRLTGDERAGDILDSWVPWAIANTTIGTDGDFAIPAEMEWSGAPDSWTGAPTGNPGLSVEVVSHNQDVGIAAGLAKTLMHYSAATGDEASLETAEALLDALLEHEGELGVAIPETRADYERFGDPYDPATGEGTYVPQGWTGTMPNGDVIDSDATFASIRSFYQDDPDWGQVEDYLDGGAVPEFTYHRFWAQVDVATALATHGELFGS